MENSVEKSLSIVIKKTNSDAEELQINASKKRKNDDTISNSFKSKKHSDTMKNRCAKCNRKMNIVSCYKCRCGNNYCIKHRFYDQHECKFDFKKMAIDKLIMNNPKLQNSRIGDQ